MTQPFRTLTPNGTEILVETLPHVRSCALGFWVRRGSRHEGPAEEGLAHFLEHTVFKGTEAYPTPDALAEATDRLGGHVDAFTGKEVACFYGKVLDDQLPELVHLLGDLLTAPIFDPEELVRERNVILEEIAQSEDQPDDWVSELFYGRFWEGSALAHPILGRRDQVSGYGATEARAFFDHTYRAPNLVVAAAGALEPGPFMDLLAPLLAKLPATAAPLATAPMGTRPFLLNTPRKDLQQASLVLGFPAPGHRSPDRAAVHLLSHVLGGGMASRLFMELRERRGLCYQVGSYLSPYADSGALQISASCAPAQLRELVKRALAECARLRTSGVEVAELERAKLQARTGLVFSQESSSSRMFSLAHQAIHHGELRSLDQQMAEIEAVTPDDLLRVAQDLLDPAQVGLSALGTRRGCDIRPQDLVA
ncbi:MAG: pitrilysin family protein [Acidobacteria bacterium]|nr:pitrilysin family protein [Acidobacteriota bacterium]